MFKEFVILKIFKIVYIKVDGSRVPARCWFEKSTKRVHASSDKGAKSFSIRKFFSEHTCNIMPAKIRIYIPKDFGIDVSFRGREGECACIGENT